MMNLLPIYLAAKKLFPGPSARSLAVAALDGKLWGKDVTLRIDLEAGTITLRQDGVEQDLVVKSVVTYTSIGKANIVLGELK